MQIFVKTLTGKTITLDGAAGIGSTAHGNGARKCSGAERGWHGAGTVHGLAHGIPGNAAAAASLATPQRPVSAT